MQRPDLPAGLPAGEPAPWLTATLIAHELGHQLGLFHTTEADGSAHDPISDTPECPAAQFDHNRDGMVDPDEGLDWETIADVGAQLYGTRSGGLEGSKDPIA